MVGPTLGDRSATRRKRVPEKICGLTDDIRSIVLYEVSNFRGIAPVDYPTGLRHLVELLLDFRTEFVCGAGPPVRTPMNGIQADVRYVQQLGESTAQRRLTPRKAELGCGLNIRSFTHDATSYLSGAFMITHNDRARGKGRSSFTLVFLFTSPGS